MSLTVQVLVLVLSFPAVGLLLYILTVAERWLLSDPVAKQPRQRARHAEDQTPTERQAVILSLAHRPRQRAASSAPQAGQEGEATSSHRSGRAGSGAG
jgi:hypothetical protein